MCESLVKNLWRSGFWDLTRDWLMTADLRNKPREKHTMEFEESLIAWILRVTYDSSQVASDSRNSLLVAFWSVIFPILYQQCINPHYPWNVRRRRSIFWRNFRERNPSQTLESYIRTYVFHMLGSYVTILCNWLILWQNTLYL